MSKIIEVILKYKYEIGLAICCLLYLYLGFYKVGDLMNFIGDQGWFYLSARDMVLGKEIPLVGIASSHPWLHQGPFWTYMLAPFLWIFNFNPVSGAYLSIAIGLFSVIGMYAAGKKLFNKQVGLTAALLYSTSPMVIFYAKFPYHIAPIPLFIILLIVFSHKVINGKINNIPLVFLTLTVLYNFEIVTFTFWVAFLAVLFYMHFRDRKVFNGIDKARFGFKSLLYILIPLSPMILYDVKNGFPQTLKFGAWVFYRAISLFGYNPEHTFSLGKIKIVTEFIFVNFVKIIFGQSKIVTFIIMLIVIVWLGYLFYKRKINNSQMLLTIFTSVPLVLVILNQVSSDAYMPMFFPVIFLLISSLFNYFYARKELRIFLVITLLLIPIGNIHFLFRNRFDFNNTVLMSNRTAAVNNVLNIAGGKKYNLIGRGQGSEFESFTMNYGYIAWWMGNEPSSGNERIKIFISESKNKVIVDAK